MSSLLKAMIMARNEYSAGRIDQTEFRNRIRNLIESLNQIDQSQKDAIFATLVGMLSTHLTAPLDNDPYEDTQFWVDDDDTRRLTEELFMLFFGKTFYKDFYNDLYTG